MASKDSNSGIMVQEYNGSSWTAAGIMVTSITQIANAGTETAAVFAGGYTYNPGYIRLSYN